MEDQNKNTGIHLTNKDLEQGFSFVGGSQQS